MQKRQLSMLASAIFACAGCMRGEAGGPGVKTAVETQVHTVAKPVIENSKESFNLRTPALGTTVKRGESKSIVVAVSRGSEFKDDIQISFAGVPVGVTFSPLMATLKGDDNDLKIEITAAHDAQVGEYSAVIKGRAATGGPDATNRIKFSVAE